MYDALLIMKVDEYTKHFFHLLILLANVGSKLSNTFRNPFFVLSSRVFVTSCRRILDPLI